MTALAVFRIKHLTHRVVLEHIPDEVWMWLVRRATREQTTVSTLIIRMLRRETV